MNYLEPAREVGATYLGDGRCRFRVWAPATERVDVRLLDPQERVVQMTREDWGYHAAEIAGVAPGTRYWLRLYGRLDRPDPASRCQPEGVHGPSAVVDLRYPWTDAAWRGRPLAEHVLYELHVGTFTRAGTLDAAIARLDDLHKLGVTAIELMPLAQFPGERNWGYDGVYPFAVQNSYGGAAALQRFVDACHARSLAVVLDVVHNHLGPEGNYLADFGPYFTDRFRTPWGPAVNLEGPHSDPVRAMFIANSHYWIEQFHVDGLRLDAVHALVDRSVNPFLAELSDAVRQHAQELGRRVHLFAESNQNNPRLTLPSEQQGLGIDAQWNDDFHHALHAALTGESTGYYIDFGTLEHLAKAIGEGFVLTCQHSYYRHRRWGLPGRDIPRSRLVVAAQNHDQTGNRRNGDRLSTLVDYESLKLAATATLLSPFVPLLFMGEEYGELAPFLYFVSHGDKDLIANVRAGRKRDFAAFQWQTEPPDPQSPSSFDRSKLNDDLRGHGPNSRLWDFHRELLRLRRSVPALAELDAGQVTAGAIDKAQVVYFVRTFGESAALVLLAFGEREVELAPAELAPCAANDTWIKRIDSADARWSGPGGTLPNELSGTCGAVKMPRRSAALFVRR